MTTWRDKLAYENAVKHGRKILPFHEKQRELERIIADYERENLAMHRHIAALEAAARDMLIDLDCGADVSEKAEILWDLLEQPDAVEAEVAIECEGELHK